MSEKALLIAREDILRVVQAKRPALAYDEAVCVADAILSSIDWENVALMHKSIEWIATTYLEQLVTA